MGFSSENRERTRPVLPLAGMVDVLFLLLIFFMTASVFRDQELVMEVDLPGSGNEQLTAGTEAMQTVVTVGRDDVIYVGERAMDLGEVKLLFAKLAETYPDERVLIRGDKGCSYGTVMDVIDAAQMRGLVNVSQGVVKRMADLE